jgi:hypothetical protein
MIAKMIVSIRGHDVEDDSRPQFRKVLAGFRPL